MQIHDPDHESGLGFYFCVNIDEAKGVHYSPCHLLPVFFPTGYQQVYDCVSEAFDVGVATKGLGQYNKTITVDGKSVTCTMLPYCITIEIK